MSPSFYHAARDVIQAGAVSHRVKTSHTFCYGHRIRGHAGKCGHLHGHNARVEVECAGPLDDLAMVVDFAAIKEAIGAWIDAHWDHRMILDKGDPLAALLDEQGEPIYLLDAPPTAESMAAHLFGVARDAGLPVAAVHLWESDTSCASYHG